MRLLESGKNERYDPVFIGQSSFIFTGAVSTGITKSWTRSYNIYSTQGVVQNGEEREPQAIIAGDWPNQTTQYFYSNSPIRAYGHSNANLNAVFTGYFNQTQKVDVFDACRGQAMAYDLGQFNFYHGFHPMGYYSPPYGEVPALSEVSTEQYALHESELSNGSCANLTYENYNQLRGIVSANIFGSENLKPINVGGNPILGKLSPIHGPYEECPPQLTKPFYFTELLFAYGAGTYAGGIAGNPYNHNPIPTALDYLDLQLTSRYNQTQDVDGNVVVTGVGETEDFTNVANYGTGSSNDRNGLNNDLLLNNKLSYNTLCGVTSMEGSTTAGISIGGSLDLLNYDPASPLNAGSVSPSFNYNPWHYWHFTFKENHDYLPFYNSQTSSPKLGVNPRPQGVGTQLFDAKLADSDHWWENRQCPEVVDFLPWTFGATIYDCPRNYFEIPYYSTLGKFGYYGARFAVSCQKLLRDTANDVNGQKTPIPVYEIETPLATPVEYSQGEVDGGGASSDFYFDALLNVAHREQNYTEWSVTNRGYYLWANKNLVENSATYSGLVSEYPRFETMFNGLKSAFDGKLKSLAEYVSGQSIDIKVDPVTFQEDYSYYDTHYNNAADFAHLNDVYNEFSNACRREITGVAIGYLDSLIRDYGFLIKTSPSTVNYAAYTSGVSGQERRIRTRYLMNITHGKPVDLFPTNHVMYSFDNKTAYQNSTLWARKFEGSASSSSFGAGGLSLPEVPRRYFEGAFAKRAGLTGLIQLYNEYKAANPNSLDDNASNDFTLGSIFKSESCGKMTHKGAMIGVIDGTVINTSNGLTSTTVNAWRALGYNEIGKLDRNFSCFTPVLVQQPKHAFCKIGQQPTFRALALDYHTLPEDKIGVKHPEIHYWCNKLKLLSQTNQYLYPMKYVWGRVPMANSGEYLKGNYSHNSIQYAYTGGEWSCLENNDGKDCTFIHPKECVASNGITIGYNGSSKNSYSFMQGVKAGDTAYAYFCLASGRYGIRGSDPFIIEADKFLLIDAALINGGGATLTPAFKLKIDSTVVNNALQDGAAIDEDFDLGLGAVNLGIPFAGLKQSPYVVPEEVMIKKRYIRAGGGQNVGFGFDGPDQYRGFLRSYAPETLEDTRGLRATNHRPIEYGVLARAKLTLSDKIGGALYGHSHLPVCANYTMADGRKGVRIEATIDGVAAKHKLITRPAEIGMTNPPSPMKSAAGYASQVPNIYHVGQLYNFDYPGGLGTTTSWQFHQNLGPVRRFGHYTQAHSVTPGDFGNKGEDFIFVRDMSSANPQGATDAFNYVRDVVVTPTTLAGANCGYVEPSLGRKTLYFVEAFDRFYILCDAKAKYNVQNKSFIAPGLRFGDAPFQYAWVGQPSDTYLTRKSMYGPYAYQWKVNRHNRDRLGNGISEGFYSMGWGEKYSLMYDAAAIYGMYCKNDSNQGRKNTIDRIIAIRNIAFPNSMPRRIYLGRRGSAADGYGYGDVRADCETISAAAGAVFNGSSLTPNQAALNSNGYAALCAYYDIGSSNLFDGTEYYCSRYNVQDGVCFDPCLSIRYSHGFMPGGKKITHMTNGAAHTPDGGGPKYKTAITQNGEDDDKVMATNTQTNTKTILRGPANTPYAQGIKDGTLAIATPYSVLGKPSVRTSYSISPCEPGGADHCNYNTPTLHIGGNSSIIGAVNGLTSSNYNIFSALT